MAWALTEALTIVLIRSLFVLTMSGFPHHFFGHTLQWGDVATWFAAVAASVAALMIYRLEHNRDRDQAEASMRAQAEQVSIFYRLDQPNSRSHPTLVLVNRSNQPITDVVPYVRHRDGEMAKPHDGPLLIVGPGTEIDVKVYKGHMAAGFDGIPQLGEDDLDGTRPGVIFTDASGSRRWDRRPDATLSQVDRQWGLM